MLARKAKRICELLGIDALAAKYNVEATPEAVATAYAASYPPHLPRRRPRRLQVCLLEAVEAAPGGYLGALK